MDLSKLKIVDLKKLIADNQIKCENIRKMKKADLIDVVKTSDYYNNTYNINEEQKLVTKLEVLEKKAGQKQTRPKKVKKIKPEPIVEPVDETPELKAEEYMPIELVDDEPTPIAEKPKPIKKSRAKKKVENSVEIPSVPEPVTKPVKKVRKPKNPKVDS